MMEIIKIKNTGYARYEELLFKRDRLRKEANIYHVLYVKEFGDLMLNAFQLQLECIKLKKRIGYVQAAINRGEAVDQAQMEEKLQEEMKEYQEQLNQKIFENEASKKSKEITSAQELKIRRLYHKLAKQLHPDINPKTIEVPELRRLWEAVVTAYSCNSLGDLQEAEVLVNKAMEKLNMGCMEIEIPDLPDKIAACEEGIQKIILTDPYQYKFILSDPEAVAAKKTELREQTESSRTYKEQLEGVLDQLLKSGVRIIWKIS